MRLILIFIFVFGSIMGFAQEQIYPATIHTNLTKRQLARQSERFEAKTGESIELPFVDDFSADHFPGNEMGRQVFWENRTASLNNGWPIDPPTVGVVSFDGADEVGYPYSWSTGTGPADTLTSCPINLEGDSDDGIGISFYFQPKGMAYNGLSDIDSLVLEFYAPELEEWFWIWSTNDDSATEEFTFVYIPILNDKYLKDEFQFRFRNYAPLQGAVNTWNLDYVWVDLNSTNQNGISNDVAFVVQEHTLLNGLTAIPRDHFAIDPASHMIADINVQYRNLDDGPRTLQGNAIRLINNDTGTEEENLLNLNNPSIQAMTQQPYFHTVHDSPNNITYDPSLSDTKLSYEVQFIHTVSDFSKTSSNDTMRFNQDFFTHYSYDDGSAEAAYSVPTAGSEIAMRYVNLKSDSIWAVQIYTMPLGYDFENTPFTIQVWDEVSGAPGTVIGSELLNVEYGIDDYQQSIIYQFEEPVAVPAGPFYAGYKQSSQDDGVRIGLDRNTNGNEGNLKYKESSNWTSSVIPGTVMIRPMFTSNGYEDLVTGVSELDFSNELKVYPNPTNGQVNVSAQREEKLWVTVSDLTGRTVAQFEFTNQSRFDTSDLINGIYLMTFDNKKGARGVKKLVVNH